MRSCRERPGSTFFGWRTKFDIPFVATRVTLPELLAADEVILFGTTIEVLPVARRSTASADRRRSRPVADSWLAGGQGFFRHELEHWLASSDMRQPSDSRRSAAVAAHPGVRMTTTEASDDPFAEHHRRDPLPNAGIRIILLTDSPGETATGVDCTPWRI